MSEQPGSPYLRLKSGKFDNAFKKLGRKLSVRYTKEKIPEKLGYD